MNCTRYLLLATALVSLVTVTGCGNKGGSLEQIKITPQNVVIVTGQSAQFSSVAVFGDGTVVNWTSATTWSTSDENLVSISNSFNTYGLAESISHAPSGTIIVTGSDPANNITSSVTLSIMDPQAILIHPSNPYLRRQMTHQFLGYAFLTENPNISLHDLTTHMSWTTSPGDPIARVSETGLVTTLNTTGTTTLYATYKYRALVSGSTVTMKPITGTTTLTVWTIGLNSITLSSDITGSVVSLSTGTVQFTATAIFSDGTTTVPFTESAHWTSSNKEIATVGNHVPSDAYSPTLWKGYCTFLKAGTVTIKATDPITGHYAQQTFTITTP